MPSLLSQSELDQNDVDFNNLFDTFARDITIYKEPLKTPQVVDANSALFGFGENQTQDLFSYTPVSGIYQATIRYPVLMTRNEFRMSEESNIKIPEGGVSIKVRMDCKDFILNGITEKIDVDGRTYYLDSDGRGLPFLKSKFWIFVLKPTK